MGTGADIELGSDASREHEGGRVPTAEAEFRAALVRAHEHPAELGRLEAAAARFCRELKGQGLPPEVTLRLAKRVIAAVIHGDDVRAAEHAVRGCIRHYYQSD